MPNEIPGQSTQQPASGNVPASKPQKKRRSARTPENVADILDRRNESRRYMQINYWDEWEDAYRATKCRTKPIMVTDKTGQEVEDKTRTNVAMPELSLIARRKTARLTANPPQLNFTVPHDQDGTLADRLSAWAYQQFDKSGEAQEHRKLVQTGVTFGWAISKLYWDTVYQNKKFFRSTDTGNFYSLDRGGMMRLGGAPDDEISDAVKEQGSELGDEELMQAISKYGNSAQVSERMVQFEGPVSKNVFVGDFFHEPGCASLDVSGWAIEDYFESDVFLEKMAKETYEDPDSGEDIPVFDPKAIQELQDMPSWQPIYMQQPFDLRSRLRTNALGQTLPLWPTKLLKGKRYDILECHTRDKYGNFWIEYVGNEKVYLGKKPYPWDLYGRYCYTELTPLFDILSSIGDSTPRLLRWLWLLHNSVVGSRRDLVMNILRPLMKGTPNMDVPDEQIDRALFRLITMRDPNQLQPLIEPVSVAPAIAAAGEEEAQVMRMMALAEPNLTNVETGTDANPQAGKTATTAVLAAKSADALTQFELDSLSWYLKQSGEKKLAMLQQTEPEMDANGGYKPYQISPKFTSQVEGLSQRYGKAQAVNLQFMEIQQEIQVEPAAMSMLSVDDELRRNAAMQLGQMAAAAPGIFDPYYVARFAAGTIRGIDPDKAVPPPQPPAPTPPKMTVSIAVKWDELPIEAQQALMKNGGIQITPELQQELGLQKSVTGVGKLSEAADAAENLLSHSPVGGTHQDTTPDTPMSKGVNG